MRTITNGVPIIEQIPADYYPTDQEILNGVNYTIPFSFRAYVRDKEWRGFSTTYGHEYYQLNQTISKNTALPEYNATLHHGYLLASDYSKLNFNLNEYRTNNGFGTINYSIDVVRGVSIIHVTIFTTETGYKENIVTNHQVDFSFQEGDKVLLAVKPSGSAKSTANISGNFKFS